MGGTVRWGTPGGGGVGGAMGVTSAVGLGGGGGGGCWEGTADGCGATPCCCACGGGDGSSGASSHPAAAAAVCIVATGAIATGAIGAWAEGLGGVLKSSALQGLEGMVSSGPVGVLELPSISDLISVPVSPGPVSVASSPSIVIGIPSTILTLSSAGSSVSSSRDVVDLRCLVR